MPPVISICKREGRYIRLHWVKSYRSHGLNLTLPDFATAHLRVSVQVSPQSGRTSRGYQRKSRFNGTLLYAEVGASLHKRTDLGQPWNNPPKLAEIARD